VRRLAQGKDLPYPARLIHSRISSKAQTTIPRAVRTALGLKQGDDLVYEIDGDRVVLSRRRAHDPFEDPFALFTEWADEADSVYDVLDRG
jgi:antitoxin PrlF